MSSSASSPVAESESGDPSSQVTESVAPSSPVAEQVTESVAPSSPVAEQVAPTMAGWAKAGKKAFELLGCAGGTLYVRSLAPPPPDLAVL